MRFKTHSFLPMVSSVSPSSLLMAMYTSMPHCTCTYMACEGWGGGAVGGGGDMLVKREGLISIMCPGGMLGERGEGFITLTFLKTMRCPSAPVMLMTGFFRQLRTSCKRESTQKA